MLHSIDAKQETFYYRASWVQLFRPMTLTGTITPILAGTGMAAALGTVRADVFIAMLVASLLIQGATNLFNDYYDFQHGQDQEKWTANPSDANGPAHSAIPYAASAMIITAVIVGGWLSLQSSLWIIPIGVAGIVLGFLYSAGPRPLCSIGLGETVAFVSLGPIVTVISYTVQGNTLDLAITAVSMPFALIIAAMILTNNIRDIQKDNQFRHTLANLLGRARAVNLLTTLLSLAYFTVIGLILSGILTWASISVLLALPFAIRLRWLFRLNARRQDELNGMKWAAWHHWSFGLLLALSMWI